MMVKELFGTKIIYASFLFANSNISVKYFSKDFLSVVFVSDFEKNNFRKIDRVFFEL